MYQKSHGKDSWYRFYRKLRYFFKNVQNCIFSYVQVAILLFSPREKLRFERIKSGKNSIFQQCVISQNVA